MLAEITAQHAEILGRPDLQLDRAKITSELWSFGSAMERFVRNGTITSLDALVNMSIVAAILTRYNAALFVGVMADVLLGFSGDNVPQILWNRLNASQHLGGFNSSGFHSDYQDPDPTNNQVYHFWFSVLLGFNSPRVAAVEATAHETRYPLIGGGGDSINDWRLSVIGTRVGAWLQNGNLTVDMAPGWMRYALSHPFPGCGGAIDASPIFEFPVCTR
jgi:hypothetical protein